RRIVVNVGKNVVTNGSRRSRGRRALNAIVGGCLGLGVAVAAQVDGLQVAHEKAVLVEADAEHLGVGWTVPRASVVAHSHVVINILVVEDQASINELVGMEQPVFKLGLIF